MFTVVTANPKGGTGKTTSTLLLSTTAANRGVKVTVIDCDPNTPHKDWRGGESKSPVTFDYTTDEGELDQKLQQHKATSQLVIIDLEGKWNTLMSEAITMADLVLIPMAPSTLDEKQAMRTIALIRRQERHLNRAIPFRILFTATAARGETNVEKEIRSHLVGADAAFLNTKLDDRAAWTEMFLNRLSLYELNPKKVASLPKAINVAETFTDEIFHLMSEIMKQGRAAA